MTSLVSLIHAIERIHRSSQTLMDFAPFPSGFSSASLPNATYFDQSRIAQCLSLSPPAHHSAVEALSAHFHDLQWHQTYDADQVGAEMLSRFAYIELYGPTGQFQCPDARGYLAYWGENLHYTWHQHEAEEMYYILSGEAEFHKTNAPDETLRAGDTTYHASAQPHAMTTGACPVLAYVVWRGADLTGPLEISAA